MVMNAFIALTEGKVPTSLTLLARMRVTVRI